MVNSGLPNRQSDSPSSAPSGRLLTGTLIYAALASVGTGLILNGVPFITHDVYGFGDVANLLLALAVTLPYIPAALLAGPVARRIGGPRRLLFLMIAGMIATSAILATMPGAVWWWLLVPGYNAFAGAQWPIIESYIASGRHGPDMRRAIGLFNIVWAASVAPGMWIVSIFHGHPSLSFVVLVALHLSTLPLVMMWPKSPPAHDIEASKQYTSESYPYLLHSARIFLPTAYILINMLNPLYPGIWARLHVDPQIAPTLSSIWQVVRVLIFVLMSWRLGWHGKWWVLWLGAAGLFAGTGLILNAPTGTFVISGLILLGLGQGSIYYAALYYGMAVEHGAVDSGGRHEAVIGFGYMLGPIVGSVGYQFTEQAGQAASLLGVSGLALVVALVGTGLGMAPFIQKKRRRLK